MPFAEGRSERGLYFLFSGGQGGRPCFAFQDSYLLPPANQLSSAQKL